MFRAVGHISFAIEFENIVYGPGKQFQYMTNAPEQCFELTDISYSPCYRTTLPLSKTVFLLNRTRHHPIMHQRAANARITVCYFKNSHCLRIVAFDPFYDRPGTLILGKRVEDSGTKPCNVNVPQFEISLKRLVYR